MSRLLLMLLALSPCFLSASNMNDRLNKYLGKYGSSGNVTEGGVYQAQQAGYMTGGGVVIRNNIVNKKPITFSAPSLNSGCGGIDIYTGAFSYINKDEYVKFAKSIASNAGGYAFHLALESVSPMIAKNLGDMLEKAQKMNNFDINSCEIASQGVDAIWSKRQSSYENSCKKCANNQGSDSGRGDAREKCSTEEGIKEYNQKEAGKEFSLSGEFNIVWEVVKSLDIHREQKEVFMTLAGTYIIAKNEETGEMVTNYHEAQLEDENIIDKMVDGGEMVLYQCQGGDYDKCLKIERSSHKEEGDVEISDGKIKTKGWVRAIEEDLRGIYDKIRGDKALNEVEIRLVESTRIPVYKVLTTFSAYYQDHVAVDISQLARLISKDIMLKYLQEIILNLKQNLDGQSLGVDSGYDTGKYKTHLDYLQECLWRYEVRMNNNVQNELMFQKKVKMYEDEIFEEITFN